MFVTLTTNTWGLPNQDRLYFSLYQIYSNIFFTVFDMAGMFNAVPTVSTESRFSAGRFDSSVGSFIDPRFFNQDIGTFFFLGGFPSSQFIGDTSFLTPGTPVTNPTGGSPFFPGGPWAVNFGFARTLNENMYLAVYYGGSIVYAYGHRAPNAAAPDTYDTFAFGSWRNRLAVLFGMSNHGFRLDLVMNNPHSQRLTTEDGAEATILRQHGKAIGLTWGTTFDRLSPFARVGFRFPSQQTISVEDSYRMSTTTGSIGSFVAGTGFNLTDHSSVWGELLLARQFRKAMRGDSLEMVGVEPYRDGGVFGIGMNTGYAHSFYAGRMSFGLGINFGMGSTFLNHYSHGFPDSDRWTSDHFFDLRLNIEMGARFALNEKFSFYTGAALNIFEFNRHSFPFGQDEFSTRETRWQLFGFNWQQSRLMNPAGELGIGMTFSPNNYVVFGFGLNSVLDNIVRFNIRNMTVDAGPIWGADADSFSSWAAGIFDGIRLDMTASITIPPGGVTPRERRTFRDGRIYGFFNDIREFRKFRAAEETEEFSVEETPVAEYETTPGEEEEAD